nr:hypothetical protein [Rhizobium ruizarguesonis]
MFGEPDHLIGHKLQVRRTRSGGGFEQTVATNGAPGTWDIKPVFSRVSTIW